MLTTVTPEAQLLTRGEQCGHSAEARARSLLLVGDRDDRPRHEAANDGRKRAIHPGHHDDDARPLRERLGACQNAMNPRDADIGEAVRPCYLTRGRYGGFLGHRKITCARTGHNEDRSAAGRHCLCWREVGAAGELIDLGARERTRQPVEGIGARAGHEEPFSTSAQSGPRL